MSKHAELDWKGVRNPRNAIMGIYTCARMGAERDLRIIDGPDWEDAWNVGNQQDLTETRDTMQRNEAR